MNTIVKYGLMLAATSLVACQNKFEVSSGVDQAVLDNKNAASLVQWESSEAHPEVLFAQWNKQVQEGSKSAADLSKQICASLSKLDSVSLTVFEHEITELSNQSLLEGCREELIAKINKHYIDQRKTMLVNLDTSSVSAAGFKFPDNVQKRDTSNGYYGWSGDVGKKEIVITFDDGPSGEYTDSILASLKEVNAKAVFFSQGKNAALNPEVLKRVAADGHAIGSHSMTHRCLAANTACQGKNGFLLTFDQAVKEIRDSHTVIHNILGFVDPFFRFPYGESSPELKDFLKRNKTGEFNWNMDSEDWRATTNEQLLATALSEVTRAGRGIILFHDIQRRTAEVMPQFLQEIYKRGYSVVLLQPLDPNARYNSSLVNGGNKP